MKIKTSQQIRQAFVDYFQQHGHTPVHSSPVVPANDPTLLFTNAGMVQFKDTFLGQEKRDYNRAVTIQRCIRAGGKHNDLENVGYTARHHTFFEMLGNFSFGDYFKAEAIAFAWEFLTKTLELPAEKLWVTVYEKDDEAENIWLKDIGVNPERLSRCGEKDNFWSMGDTGPCGPCSEIFYDHGANVEGGPPGSPDEDGDRYIEIWNLVFMQYERNEDGTLTPLPNPSIDTGMGLERLAAVLQQQHNNYDIDTFAAITQKTAKLVGVEDHQLPSVRVIADHIRSCAFMIVDGVMPSNEGRGYVLRRIIRRALRHGHKLGQPQPFFHALVDVLIQQMGQAYPELSQAKHKIEDALLAEEHKFAETLNQGMDLLTEAIEQLKGDCIPGDVVFKLYDTYGFPMDLTADVAREHGLSIDEAGFETAMNQQRERARRAASFAQGKKLAIDEALQGTTFVGYSDHQTTASVLALYREGEAVDRLQANESGAVILDQTPFYGESGGQVGDQGTLVSASNTGVGFHVKDTQKQGDYFIHQGVMSDGVLSVSDKIIASIVKTDRLASQRHHSATHLLHAALRDILGNHVAQKGSLVDPTRLRFDFSHHQPIDKKTLQQIEDRVNGEILNNQAVHIAEMSIDDAKAKGAMALFGEKYGDVVRVVDMGDFSIELCGGTHVNSTAEIGLFHILSESGVASGVRRIEAIAGEVALSWMTQQQQRLTQASQLLKVQPSGLLDKLQQVLNQQKQTDKQIERLKQQLASGQNTNLKDHIVSVGDVNVLAVDIPGADNGLLRQTMDKLKNEIPMAVICLAAVDGDKVMLAAGISQDLLDTSKDYKAGELVNHVAAQVEGKGGGRADMAMAGGKNPAHLPQALNSVVEWVQGKR